MTAAFAHAVPWTEEEYLALGETVDRVELFDGSLIVSPAPTFGHQHLSRRLANALEPAAQPRGLQVYEAVNIRLRTGRLSIPDLVITPETPMATVLLNAVDVRLICEITSTNAATDNVLKMHYYAAAGIPWYLLVDPGNPTLSLYQLDGDHYVLDQKAGPGELLRFTEPIALDLDPATLTA